MNQFFSPNNPVMRFLSKLCDLIFLNVMFFISCLPIFTIGAALSALYRITLKLVDGDEPYIVKGYWKAFRENFKQATPLWLILLVILAFFSADLYVIYRIIDPAYNLLQVPVWIMIFIVVSIIIYAFPLLSNFQNDTKTTVKNAVLLSVSNAPVTIFIIVIHIVIVYLAFRTSYSFFMVLSIGMFIGCAALAYLISLYLQRIFAKVMQQSEDK